VSARHYIDIRIERPDSWEWIRELIQHQGLLEIDFQPPASGPEIELTFTVKTRGGEGELEDIRKRLCRKVYGLTRCAILAARVRDWSDPRG
jgi:hypothetical protein